jgi:hypothetical protein
LNATRRPDSTIGKRHNGQIVVFGVAFIGVRSIMVKHQILLGGVIPWRGG